MNNNFAKQGRLEFVLSVSLDVSVNLFYYIMMLVVNGRSFILQFSVSSQSKEGVS